jgi:hypothetical protein
VVEFLSGKEKKKVILLLTFFLFQVKENAVFTVVLWKRKTVVVADRSGNKLEGNYCHELQPSIGGPNNGANGTGRRSSQTAEHNLSPAAAQSELSVSDAMVAVWSSGQMRMGGGRTGPALLQ